MVNKYLLEWCTFRFAVRFLESRGERPVGVTSCPVSSPLDCLLSSAFSLCSGEYSDYCPKWLFVPKSNVTSGVSSTGGIWHTLLPESWLCFSLALYLFSFFLVFFSPFFPVPECLHSSALWAVPSSVSFTPRSSTWVPLLVNLFIPLSASFAISSGPYQSFSLVLLSRHLLTFPLDSGSLHLSELLPLHPETAPLSCFLSTAGPPSNPPPN